MAAKNPQDDLSQDKMYYDAWERFVEAGTLEEKVAIFEHIFSDDLPLPYKEDKKK